MGCPNSRVAGSLAMATAFVATLGAQQPAVTVDKDGERRSFSSDHIAFHRFVEGVKEEFGL